MLTRNYKLFSIILIVLITYGCKDERKSPDVSGININIELNRFDQDLFKLDTNNLETSLENLKQKYPTFFDLYFTQILPLKNGKDTVAFHENLKGYLGYKPVQKLQDTCQIVFDNMNDIKAQLTKALKLYKYYLPEKEAPNVYTLTSEYSYQTFVFNDNKKDGLGIGLDLFLGNDYPYAQIDPDNTVFSKYVTRTFNKDHLVKKSMDALIDDLVGIPKGNRLLDIMVHNGKKLYLLDMFLPNTPDSVKLQFKPSQVNWVNTNEKEVWAHFLAEDLLYSANAKKIAKLIKPSPMAPPGMPTEAPGEIGNWMGWQIVKMYMQRMPNSSIDDLINETDAQRILDQSKYKPKR